MVSEGIPTQVDIPIQIDEDTAHPEVKKDGQIEKEKDAMMNTQEDQTKETEVLKNIIWKEDILLSFISGS